MMYLTIKLFAGEMFQLVSIAFTTLILTELVFVASCVNFRIMWRQRRSNFALFFVAILVSLVAYFGSVFVLPATFDRGFFFSLYFWRNVGVISAASIVPVMLLRFLEQGIHRWLLARRMSAIAF